MISVAMMQMLPTRMLSAILQLMRLIRLLKYVHVPKESPLVVGEGHEAPVDHRTRTEGVCTEAIDRSHAGPNPASDMRCDLRLPVVEIVANEEHSNETVDRDRAPVKDEKNVAKVPQPT